MSMSAVVATVSASGATLAAEAPKGPEFGKASPLALLVVVVLLVSSALLIWSMNRHIRKLPKSFDPEHPEADQAADEGTDITPRPADDDSAPSASGEPGDAATDESGTGRSS